MKHLFVLLVFMLAVSTLFAQKNTWDVIELKDGKVYRGTIVEEIPGSTIRMQTEGGELLLFEMDDIRKLASEKKEGRAGAKNTVQSGSGGYFGLAEFGFFYSLLQGEDLNVDSNKTLLQITTVQGYNFGGNFTLGLGFGAAIRGEQTYFPVFIDARTYFGQGNIQPFLKTAGGFSLLFNDDNSPGNVLAEVAFGVRSYVTSSVALNTSIGFNQQFYIAKNDLGLMLNEGLLVVKIGISL